MKKTILILALIFTVQAQANITGTYMMSECRTPHPEGFYKFSWCVGFVRGASNAMVLANKYNYCPPDNALDPQLVNIILKYIKDHPETEHKHASHLILEALIKAFPCKVKK